MLSRCVEQVGLVRFLRSVQTQAAGDVLHLLLIASSMQPREVPR